jgi:16S rRNA (adenine1518-N6/adenine1519-N6)-dimethyltransferase
MVRKPVSKVITGRYKPEVSLLVETRQRLRRFSLHIRKSLGQHFLVDRAVLEGIVTAATLELGDTVIEVGPGLGVLTRELADRAGRVVAIELDDELAIALKAEMALFDNVTVVNRDILKTEMASLLGGQTEYKVVANLPYYITAAVLRHFLTASPKPRLMVLMLQKEVAEAITAPSGNTGLLALSVRFYGEASLVNYVPATSFYPAPVVDSAVVRIIVQPQATFKVSNEEAFFRLLRAAFSARRKQLRNAMAQGLGLPKDLALSLLKAVEIAPQRRAESLSLDEWVRLWRYYQHLERPSC